LRNCLLGTKITGKSLPIANSQQILSRQFVNLIQNCQIGDTFGQLNVICFRLHGAGQYTIDYEVATLVDRGVATLIDWGIFLLYLMLVNIIASIVSWRLLWEEPFFEIAIWAPIYLYDVTMETLFNGRSVGKMAMRIKVIKVDGTRPSFRSFLVRNALRPVDGILWVYTIGSLFILATGTGQRLGDIVADTTVIRMQRKKRLYDTILHRVDPYYRPMFPQVMNLTDKDIATIKDVMIICSRTRNWDALRMLTARTKEVMGVESPMPDFQFLNTVIKDYTNYNFE